MSTVYDGWTTRERSADEMDNEKQEGRRVWSAGDRAIIGITGALIFGVAVSGLLFVWYGA